MPYDCHFGLSLPVSFGTALAAPRLTARLRRLDLRRDAAEADEAGTGRETGSNRHDSFRDRATNRGARQPSRIGTNWRVLVLLYHGYSIYIHIYIYIYIYI